MEKDNTHIDHPIYGRIPLPGRVNIGQMITKSGEEVIEETAKHKD